MAWFITGALGISLLILLVLVGGRPHRFKNKGLDFIGESIQSLAVCRQGAVLVIEEDGSDRFIQFRKGRDLGDSRQEVVLGFPRAAWSEPFFDRVQRCLVESGFAAQIVVNRSPSGTRMEFLELAIQGTLWEIAEEAEMVASRVAAALELETASGLTFVIDGVRDIDMWRRANRSVWEAHVDSDKVLTRWHARRQLRKLEQG